MKKLRRIIAAAGLAIALGTAVLSIIADERPAAIGAVPRAAEASSREASPAGRLTMSEPLGLPNEQRREVTHFGSVFTFAPDDLLRTYQHGAGPNASDADAYLALRIADICIEAVSRPDTPEPANASPITRQRGATARGLLDQRCKAFYRVPIRDLREAVDRLRTRIEGTSPEFGGDIGNIHREDRPDQAKAKARQLIELYERHGTDALLWSSGALSSHLLARLQDAETDPQAFRRRERIILAATAIAHCQSGNACHADSLQTIAACASVLLCGEDLQDAVLAPFNPDDRAAAMKLAQDIFGRIQRREYAQLGLRPS